MILMYECSSSINIIVSYYNMLCVDMATQLEKGTHSRLV
uniref:Uncharacterized protein n=1 Tax=Anguilla anguilla TaxID=7936 RepID=A0A0E9QKA4_ANGAN